MDRLSNTRLTTSLVRGTDPAEGLAGAREDEPAPVIGAVPACWRELLDTRHLNDFYARILDCVRAPVEIEARPGLRRVSVLGQAVFEFDRNGFAQVYLWTWRDSEFACFAQPAEQISIGGTPHGWTWLELFRRGFVAELAWRLQREPDELQACSRWLFGRFRSRLAAECNLRHMREQIATALALDPLAVQVARRIRLVCQRPRVTTLREYNHAITHLPAYRKLQKEAPNLVPLYAAHAEFVSIEPGEPAQQLKHHLMQAYGLRPATWALAHGTKPRWLYMIEDFHKGSTANATADLLLIVQALGCRRMPPRWFLWDVLQVFGHPARRLTDYFSSWEPRIRALRRLGTLLDDADEARLAAMRAGFYEVLAWIVDDDAHLRRGISRAGWKWFVRHAAAWRVQQEKEAASAPVHWPVPFEAIRDGQYTVAVLANNRELLDEARAMSHCVDRYSWRCAKGRHLILSIRSDTRERPLATASLQWDRGRWHVALVTGAANSAPRSIAVRLAAEACGRVNAMEWIPRRPERDAPRVKPPSGEFDFESAADDVDAFLESVAAAPASAQEEEETE